MNILQAIEDPNLFRAYLGDDLSTWSKWLTMLKTLYGIRPHKSEHSTIRDNTGRDPKQLPRSGFSEALLLCGRRSGKSKLYALIGAYEAVLSGREKGMSLGEIPMVAILSPTRFQSRIIHSYLKGVFSATPLLANEVVEEKRESFRLKNGVEVAILTGDPRVARGFSLIACVVDEIAYFGLTEESKVRSDTELLRALRPSLATTGGPLIAVGSPYAAKGYAHQSWKKHFANNESDILIWNAPSTEMNPTLSPRSVEKAIEEDPAAARVEYCVERGLFREDIDDYLPRRIIEACVVPNRQELPPKRDITYRAFVDLSGGQVDDAALAIAHRDPTNDKVVIDRVVRYPSPHQPQYVVARIVEEILPYGISEVTGDWYSASWVRTEFQKHGVTYHRSSRSVWKHGSSAAQRVGVDKSQLYLELLPFLASQQVELLDNPILIAQLSSLQRMARSAGKDKGDHAPNAHDDVANVIAGVTYLTSQKNISAGAIDPTRPSYQLGKTPQQRYLPTLAEQSFAQRQREHLEDQLVCAQHYNSTVDGSVRWVSPIPPPPLV